MKGSTQTSSGVLALLRRPVVVVIIGILGLALLYSFWPRKALDVADAYFTARRGDFVISITEGGTVEAVNEVVVRSEVEGTARIIYIVPEGTYVKQGDLLVELDSAMAQDQVNQQLIAVEKANFALIQAKETLAIQQSVVDSEIRASKLKVEFAEDDLRKYIQGESLQQKQNLEIELNVVRENLALAEERFEWSQKLAEKGFETKSNLDKDRLAVTQYTLRKEQAEKALWLFETFDYPKQKRLLESNRDEAVKELERTTMQGERRLAQYRADVKTQESTVELNHKKLERDQKNLAASKIQAPHDGLVVYAIGNNRFSSESLIEEGATVRNRQELIKLPDVSEMKLAIKVHESHVNMVRPGQPAYILLDSMPDQRFRGVVRKVGLLPDSSARWGNPNLKVYATEVLITDALPNVKPGVSARAEVIITNLQNVISVPLQSVTTKRGQQVVYVAEGEGSKAVPVQVGLYNTKFIQIVSGIKEGDRVLLSPPLDTQQQDLSGEVLSNEERAAATNIQQTLPVPPTRQGPEGERSADPESPNQPDLRFTSGPRLGGEGRPRGDGAQATADQAGAPGGQRRGAGNFNREEMMKQWDKDGDGELNEEERNAMRAAFTQRRGQGTQGSQGGAEGGASARGSREGGENRAAGDGEQRQRRRQSEE